MREIESGGVLSARGFRAGSSRCGLKSSGEPDLAVIESEGGVAAVSVFTRNKFAAAPVQWDRDILPASSLRAVVVNSGNANACTGRQGRRDVEETAALAAELLGCGHREVAVASTGIIGRPLPMEKITGGVREAVASLSCGEEAARRAERAILTTDTRPKAFAAEVELQEGPCRLGGMAKGSGMIAPSMATMLAFLTTDAAVAPDLLEGMVRRAAECTFNRVTVDGDCSTNDTVLVLAGGAAGVQVREGTGDAEIFEKALTAVMQKLALAIVRDGEGACKLVEVSVTGAANAEDAERAARAVAESQLVKCALHGGDPNWGRVICAVGYSGAALRPEQTSLRLGDVVVFEEGLPTGAEAAEQVAGTEVHLSLDLGAGEAEAAIWTCDLSEEYVRINAEYHT